MRLTSLTQVISDIKTMLVYSLYVHAFDLIPESSLIDEYNYLFVKSSDDDRVLFHKEKFWNW